MDARITASTRATIATSRKHSSSVDERIKNLLTSTDLTFKQIIEQLKGEGLSASFNTIRRVNRNNRFRKPRYDAKLTPSQRRQLISQLKTEKKPNLSSLAKQYGVCHGSIWYWWDKLSRLREKNDGLIDEHQDDDEVDDDEDTLGEEGEEIDDVIDLNRLQFIGRVGAKSLNGNYIDLPISMYTPHMNQA